MFASCALSTSTSCTFIAVRPPCVTTTETRPPAAPEAPASWSASESTTRSRESGGTALSLGDGGGGGGAAADVRAFFFGGGDAADGSGAPRPARSSASSSSAASAARALPLRSAAEPSQALDSRGGGSRETKAQAVDADAQPVHHVSAWPPWPAPAWRSARDPHAPHVASFPKQRPSAATSRSVSSGMGLGPLTSA